MQLFYLRCKRIEKCSIRHSNAIFLFAMQKNREMFNKTFKCNFFICDAKKEKYIQSDIRMQLFYLRSKKREIYSIRHSNANFLFAKQKKYFVLGCLTEIDFKRLLQVALTMKEIVF